jgi:hypothetical protein
MVVEIDPINENMYVAVEEINYSTSTDWVKDFTGSGEITAIEVNNNNNNIIFITLGTVQGKVMRSDNMGSNFTDITYNLPDLGKTHSCTK